MGGVDHPVRRVLIANRGEIALRIIRACRELAIESVAVYSTADADALHTRCASHAVEIGGPPASESYLSIPRIIDAARRSGADAVHPGYGFLAENPGLAEACEEAGLRFVGPPADAIARMGSKIDARRLMAAAGVPVVPGQVPADQSPEGVQAAIEAMGLPALVKASAGGGGKGMRIVRRTDEIPTAIAGARREASAAFGDGTLYIERLLDRPRHVEIQIFADGHGTVVHLFERECSIQRRHQKVVEEAPSVALTAALRTRMCDAAVAAARAVGYRNAGTVEFLVEGPAAEARFYFLEMNTRLQVEHPVTEAVTGVDLVRAQLHVAAGGAVPWLQGDLTLRGHAIECRIYAEDPDSFLPQAGRVLKYREPTGPGVRVDAGVAEGSNVPVHYDPLLAKLVVHAESRSFAIDRARSALRHYAILGIRTNVAYLARVLAHPRFQAGDLDTEFLDSTAAALTRPDSAPSVAVAAAAAAFHAQSGPPGSKREEASALDPWERLKGWRHP